MNNQPTPAPKTRKKSKALYAEFSNEDLLSNFKKHCYINDVEIRDVIERMVSGYMDGSIKIDINDLKKT